MTDKENRRPKTVHAFSSSKLRDDQQLIHHDQQLIHHDQLEDQQQEKNLHQQEEELGQQQLEDLLQLLELQQLDTNWTPSSSLFWPLFVLTTQQTTNAQTLQQPHTLQYLLSSSCMTKLNKNSIKFSLRRKGEMNDADVGIIDVEGPVRDESHSNYIDYSSKDKDEGDDEGLELSLLRKIFEILGVSYCMSISVRRSRELVCLSVSVSLSVFFFSPSCPVILIFFFH
jgi:hypothetical protein